MTHDVIAARAGVTRSMVSMVIAGRTKSRRVEATIAKALRVPRETIWPDRRKPKRGLGAVRGSDGAGA